MLEADLMIISKGFGSVLGAFQRTSYSGSVISPLVLPHPGGTVLSAILAGCIDIGL